MSDTEAKAEDTQEPVAEEPPAEAIDAETPIHPQGST